MVRWVRWKIHKKPHGSFLTGKTEFLHHLTPQLTPLSVGTSLIILHGNAVFLLMVNRINIPKPTWSEQVTPRSAISFLLEVQSRTWRCLVQFLHHLPRGLVEVPAVLRGSSWGALLGHEELQSPQRQKGFEQWIANAIQGTAAGDSGMGTEASTLTGGWKSPPSRLAQSSSGTRTNLLSKAVELSLGWTGRPSKSLKQQGPGLSLGSLRRAERKAEERCRWEARQSTCPSRVHLASLVFPRSVI